MIQFNLLPDVKLQYIKARRSKQLVMLISVAVAATALALLVLLFINVKLQSHHIDNLTKDIKTDTATLKKNPQHRQDFDHPKPIGQLARPAPEKTSRLALF